jgi:hypothetical protein
VNTLREFSFVFRCPEHLDVLGHKKHPSAPVASVMTVERQ